VTKAFFVRLPCVPHPFVISAPVRLAVAVGAVVVLASSLSADEHSAAANFHKKVEPLLEKYCGDCHFNGVGKGKVAFDEFTSDADVVGHGNLWAKALRNVRAGLMPPREEDGSEVRPRPEEIDTLARWIKFEALGIDPANPDPGRVTVRRLNRVEYRNTIRDLMGVDFNSEAEFPPDDTGGGFDNNGDVLSISPLLLEKYLGAAETIANKGVPKVSLMIKERVAGPRDFKTESGGSSDQWSVKRPVKLAKKFTADHDGDFRIAIELAARGSFDFDPNRCKMICRVDGEEKYAPEIVWAESKAYKQTFEVKWTAGEHMIEFEVVPLPPVETPEKKPFQFPDVAAAGDNAAKAPPPAAGAANAEKSEKEVAAAPASLRRAPVAQANAARLDVRITNVTVSGPLDKKFWIMPDAYAKFFPKGAPPEDPAAREGYAAEVMRRFATRAFRRPVEEAKVKQLTAIAKQIYTQPGKTFEDGIARAVMATLASPRFLFRVEESVPGSEKQAFAPIDDYALASRLSYLLWSTMPDNELFELAGRGELRAQLKPQVGRMLKDAKAQAFVKDFTGQWLQARDVEFVPINAREVLGLPRFGRGAGAPNAPRVDFDAPIRKAMRSETEMYFDYVLKEDRSVLELIDSDYTFLNERLASHYGVPGVTGETMRKVTLPPDSPRGGVLTQGTVLAVTSNPTRTSPVKRGVFILDNILGTPPPPPPPNVPDIEESKKEFADRVPKLSEMLAVHRANKLCSSCHSRMDPLGLAMENFNAMGMWRDTEAKQPIDPSGQLITGEKFANIREMKHVLATERKMDFYRCFTEKLLTYALGRGLEASDTHTVDLIVDRLGREDGKMSAALFGVIESAPFQKQRTAAINKPLALRDPKP
jgi:hypothetical protein